MAEVASDNVPLEAQLPDIPVENEEEDVCRVCRVEGDEEMPLIYPCKCSGSVRYVHPDCLKSWLAASQKKHCEICGYKYNFTKVYPDYIPRTIPPTVYIRQGLMWLGDLGRRIFRLWIATNTWLILLPALNMSTLRTSLWFTDFLSPSPPSIDAQAGNETLATNTTIIPSLRWDNDTRIAVGYMISHPVSAAGFLARDSWTRWNAGEQDTAIGYIFRGQVLTLTLAAVVLGLVLIREWMAQHILTDPSKPAEPLPEPRKPIYIMNGVVMDNRHDAYLAYPLNTELSPLENMHGDAEFQRTKRSILTVSLVDRLQVRVKDIQIYLRGNPFIGEEPLNADSVKKITTLNIDCTVGDLKRGPDPELMTLYPTVHGIMERLFDAKRGCTNPKRDAFGDLIPLMADANFEPITNFEGSKVDKIASLQASWYTFPPAPLPGLGITPGSPPAASSSQSSTPPRPVNADDRGFDEHVSYTAPELLEKEENVDQNAVSDKAAAGPSDHLSGPEQLRQARLARFEKRQSLKAQAEEKTQVGLEEAESVPEAVPHVADEPLVKLGESSRTGGAVNDDAAEDGEGWETDDSDGNPKTFSRQRVDGPSSVSSGSAHDGSDFSVSRLDQFRQNQEMIRRMPDFRPANNPILNESQVLFHDAEGSRIIDTNDGSFRPNRIPNIRPDRIPNFPPNRNDNETVYFIRDPARPDGPIVPMDLANLPPLPHPMNMPPLPDPANLPPIPDFAHMPTPNTNAPEDDPEDDADEEEGEDEQEDEHEHEHEHDGHGDHAHDHVHDQEEMDELDREDWNGVLEVVGLIGPIQNLAQNVCFGFVIIGASMSILVGIPIWIGRLFLSIDYWHAATYSTVLVIKGTRLIFDPVVRVIYDILAQVVVMPALSSIKALEKIVADTAGLGHTSLPKVTWIPAIPPVIREKAASRAGDVFALIGSTTLDRVTQAYAAHGTWSAKILSTDSLSHRLWTMGYGYAVVLSILGFVALDPAGFRGQRNGQFSGHVSESAQYLKLAFFMFAELVIFPTTIGGVIQICVVPLVPDWSVEKLFEYLHEVPFGLLFATWIIGTSFMFMFAGILQTLRKMCRKGVLFFIRDPTERSYNPVKDILERPTVSQMRKLGISAMMYTIVAIFLFGATFWGISSAPLASLHILPLRTSSFNSISTVPFDLLFFSIAVSPTLAALRFGNRGRRWMRRWWATTASMFNLTAMLTDTDRTRKVESPVVLGAWRVLDFFAQIALGKHDTTETWARVPSADSVVLLKPEVRKGRGVFVRLDNIGRTLTPDGALLMHQQNQAAIKANRDPLKDYKRVWLPRYWRTRVHAVVYTALVLCGTVVATALFAPLIVGRLILDRAFGYPVHDGYNWLVGVYMLWATIYLGQAVRKHIVLSQLAGRLRRSNSSTRAKRVLLGALERTFVLTTLYLIMPTLVGIGWELYIAMPLRYSNKSYTPVLHFWEAWAMGLVLLLTYVAVTHDSDHHPGREGRPMVLGQQMRECYRTAFSTDARTVLGSTYQFIGSVLFIDIAPSLLTVIYAFVMLKQEGVQDLSVYYRLSHPVLLLLLLVGVSRKELMRRWSRLRQILIDAEYVLEERVENYDPDRKKKVKFGANAKTFDGSSEEDDGEVWEDVEVEVGDEGDDNE